MPIIPPIWSAFRVYLPRDFIYDEVREKFSGYLRALNIPYRDVTDYLNDTIINSRLPGIEDENTRRQLANRGRKRREFGRYRKFQSGLQPEEQIEKQLSLDFLVKTSYINWLIMYMQVLVFLKRKGENKEKEFLPPIYLQVLDNEDNIIIEVEYKEIHFKRLTDLEFNKQERGILSRTFTLTLGFNDFDMIFHTDKTQSSRDAGLHEY